MALLIPDPKNNMGGLVRPFTTAMEGVAQPQPPITTFLSSRLCSVGDTLHMLNNPKTAHGLANWRSLPAKRFMPPFMKAWGGIHEHDGQTISVTKRDVEQFIENDIIVLDAKTYAPHTGSFVVFEGEERLNTFEDKRLAGDSDNIDSLEEFLKIVRNSICNEPDELSLIQMLEILFDQQNVTPFKWVIHWLAFRYQKQGAAIPTVLILSGGQGSGKGTLVSAVKAVQGSVKKVDSFELKRGWTDTLYGADFLEMDETRGETYHEFNDLMKKVAGNDTITIATRNQGAATQPSVSSIIMTTNQERPMIIEDGDRRYTLIKTVSATDGDRLAYWKSRITAFHNNADKQKVYSGLAALFTVLDVDVPFVMKPCETGYKSKLVSYFKDDDVETWWEYEKENGTLPTYPIYEDLYSRYSDWSRGSKAKTKKQFIAAFETLTGCTKSSTRIGNRKKEYIKIPSRNGNSDVAVILPMPSNPANANTICQPDVISLSPVRFTG